MALSEEQAVTLVRQVAQDPAPDSPEFSRLVEEYDSPLKGFVRGRSRSDADADEIRTIAWQRFWRALPRYEPAKLQVYGLLRLKATQAAIDYYRKARNARQLTILLEDLAGQMQRGSASDADWDPEEHVPDDSARPVDEVVSDWEQERTLLWIAFDQTASDAWELVAYGFHFYLGWTCPEMLEPQFVEPPLRDLAKRLNGDFVQRSQVPASELDPIFARLLGMVVPPDPGDRTLPMCSAGKSLVAKVIEGWSHNVFRRTVVIAARTWAPRIQKETAE